LVLGAEVLARLQEDVLQWERCESDAWDGVLPGVAEDARLVPWDGAAEKSAGPELDVLAQLFPASDVAAHRHLHSGSAAVVQA